MVDGTIRPLVLAGAKHCCVNADLTGFIEKRVFLWDRTCWVPIGKNFYVPTAIITKPTLFSLLMTLYKTMGFSSFRCSGSM